MAEEAGSGPLARCGLSPTLFSVARPPTSVEPTLFSSPKCRLGAISTDNGTQIPASQPGDGCREEQVVETMAQATPLIRLCDVGKRPNFDIM